MSIATPEGVELDLVLAGAGSRFIAGLLDALLRGATLLALFVLAAMSGISEVGAVVLLSLGSFLVLFGYDVLFELAAGGRTPGKRWTGLRVVGLDGGPVTVGSSVVRNLLRIVDALPGPYLVGILLVALTRRHQRLGDLVAGTVVIRERRDVRAGPVLGTPVVAEPHVLDGWDVSAITTEEVAAVRRFLERRPMLTDEARGRLARELAARLRPKVVGPDERATPEQFLQDLVAAKAGR